MEVQPRAQPIATSAKCSDSKRSRLAAHKKRKRQKRLSGSKNRLRAKNEVLVKAVESCCHERDEWRSKAETLPK